MVDSSEIVCILGPLAERVPQCPGLVMSVEQAAGLSLRLDVVAGDLDALLSPSVPLSAARFWLVHLHGDNLALSRLLADSIHGSVVYTNQRYCLWPVLGIGGFTDGDRLVALAMALGFREIRLIGFDLGEPRCVGKRSCDLEAKRVKLIVASSIISRLAEYYGYSYTKSNVLIKGSFM